VVTVEEVLVTTPQRGILEMLIVALLVNKFTIFYGT
jgi:hypothetical protein